MQFTSFWARAARRRKADVTSTLERELDASLETRSTGSDLVMLISLGVRMVLGMGVESRGRSGMSGTGGWTAAMVASRCCCVRMAIDCHDSRGLEDEGAGSMEGEARLEWMRV